MILTRGFDDSFLLSVLNGSMPLIDFIQGRHVPLNQWYQLKVSGFETGNTFFRTPFRVSADKLDGHLATSVEKGSCLTKGDRNRLMDAIHDQFVQEHNTM